MMAAWNIRRRGLFLFFLCTISLFPLVAVHLRADASPGQKSFLWKVRSNASTVYLLGSVHAFRKGLYPLPRKIEDAFSESDTLVVEADINGLGVESAMAMLGGALYPENETLERHLSSETFELAKKRLAGFGIPIELFQKTKPWLLALMISALEMQKLGLDPEYGIDRHFLDKARDGKRIVELESIAYQVNLLSSLSDAEQDVFLLHTLKDMDHLQQEMEIMLTAWSAGDTKVMESILTKEAGQDPGISSVYEKLLSERNKGMSSRIEGFLKTGGKYFVVVGAGHLVGKGGIPELLRGKGYSVEQQ